ncbi:MAG: hypothetical protein AB2693_11465 [Candidatus Thiodiazotropha sp.]
MPYHRRNKKRHRNKSSPQVVSSPKKHRQSEIAEIAECEKLVELTDRTDSESVVGDSEMSSIMETGDSNQTQLSAGASPAASEQGLDMSQSLLRNTNVVPHVEPQPQPQQQFVNGSTQYFANSGPGIMDPSVMPQPPTMNFPPQQMLNYAHPMQQSAHMAQFTQIPQGVSQGPHLSEEDVLRIATKVKMLLRDEIADLVEQRLALVMEPIKSEISAMKEALAKVQNDLKLANVRNDDLEQYSRRSCLRISGINETVNEDTTKIVLDLAKRVGASIDPKDIDISHRVGRPINHSDISDEPQAPPGRREIIVKFNNYNARLNLLKGRSVLRAQKANIFINEDLTKKRKDLAYMCRQLKKNRQSCVTKTWVYNGNVYIQDNSESKHRITCIEDLEPFKP